MADLRKYGLRQLEWDGGSSETDPPFGSANAAIQRHNREILSAYEQGFKDAVGGALICVRQWEGYDLLNHGKTAQGIRESILQMTLERHAEYLEKQRS